MLGIPFLRNILLVSLLFATIFPLYDLLFIIPSYQKILVDTTEAEAARFVRFLVVSNDLDQLELRREGIPLSLIQEVEELRAEAAVLKLRIFSPSGEIVFSSEPQELGRINREDYFRQHVVQGQLYSKVVRKEKVTAEGVLSDRDLVETYVPVMVEGSFRGAMEVYSDITASQQRLRSLSRLSFAILVTAAVGLLLMTLLLLFRARNSIMARDRAEAALRSANEDLEERVRQRTTALSSTNQLLAAEITERQKAQQAQQEALLEISAARERTDAILASVADALLVTDPQDTLMLLNPAAEELFGVRAVEIIGRPLPELIGFDELLLKLSKARNEFKDADAVEFDFVLGDEQGSRTYQGRASRLRDPQGRGRGLILLIHDVSRERQIDQMKSEFVSMAAHELQTPLTMILGYSELLIDPESEHGASDQAEFLQIINDKSIELSRLIDDILDLSRIEDGRGMLLDFAPVDMEALCRQALSGFIRIYPQHRFVLECSEASLSIHGDALRLIQVMENLLDNAVKYSPQGGLVQLRLSREENWLQLEVVDQGIGMSGDEIANAFERFYRGDSSNTAARGTGLGLSIARFIVDAHGGDITIRSSKGKGSVLSVRLPML